VLRPPLALEARGRGRDEAELLHALTRALEVLVNSGAPESALRASFAHAMAGLAAEKGMLIQVRRQSPLDLAILHAGGLCDENADSIRALRSSPGISPTLIRKAIESGESCLMENSAVPGLYGTASLAARPSSVLCVPVAESLTGAVVAVLYFENEASRPFAACDLAWLSAYAAALGQALTLHVAGERRILELEAEWRRARDADGPDILGESEATRELVEELNLLLPSTARPDAPPILVTGESGTGKELVARYLHHYSARRSRGPFQAFNCAGLRGELAESKLFGHVRGAFTGAVADAPGLFRAAHKGVLLLDEIGELPASGQSLLLRVLETRTVQPVGDTRGFPVDVQIVAATNRKLARQVARGAFREDLYYRLSGLEVELVPLRDPRRLADVRPLLGYYIARHERALQKKTMGLTRAALAALLEFAWPGNVRQLSNVCLSLVTHAARGAWIDVADIARLQPEVLTGARSPEPAAGLATAPAGYAEALHAFRRRLVLDRLRQHGGSVVAAAASLRISAPTFYRYWSAARRRA
jgi:DNA-binding NtrC family response regulator